MQRFTVLIMVFFIALINLTMGNWYGKRGEEVDDIIKKYLQRRISEEPTKHNLMTDSQALRVIESLLSKWSRETKLMDMTEENFD